MAEVTLTEVGKTYDNAVLAVEDVSFTVQDKEFLVLVGPSGCGKSTLLRMIAGLEDISDGTIAIDGRVVNAVAPRDRDIAMVFQNYALYPHMNVFDNMAMGLRIRKMAQAEIRERVGEAARLLGIDELLQRRPRQLSGGQRQRVAVGRAIVRRPKVFLFDEPLSNLDAKMRVEMRTEISRLHRRLGATMIYVTHDQTEAMTMGDRIVVLKDGRVQQIATPLDLYNRPANRFVASFVGSPPMNFWSVRLQASGDARFLLAGGEALPIQGALPRQLAELQGRNLVLGVRPEDLHMTAPAGCTARVPARLEVVEPLGSETLLYFPLDGKMSVARVEPSSRAEVGAELALHADLTRAHLFDATSEETLVSWPRD